MVASRCDPQCCTLRLEAISVFGQLRLCFPVVC